MMAEHEKMRSLLPQVESEFQSPAAMRAGKGGNPGCGVLPENGVGGRYRIRTYDFHRVKMALYR
jgi:hypothetical protein